MIGCFITSIIAAQCTGNLGENIFTDGDFGSGATNILIPDPQIAPGYLYATDPPPVDGFYTITNNTTTWGSFAENWANISDNSSDPFGYMMVVNASFDTGLFYEQLVEGLCENTLYVFSADVYNLITSPGSIRPNLSFLLDGQVQFESGDVPENNQWNTYGFTFTTGPNQTAVTLALRNNAPGGIGNDLAIDNISFRACGPEALILPQTIANICEDGSPIDLEATIVGTQYDTPAVQWQQSFDGGQTWQDIPGETDLVYTHTELSAGMYYYRYLLANGTSNLQNPFCRVNSNVKIVNVVPKFYTIVDTLCEGLAFSLKDSLYTETGVYTDSLLTFLGCDSIVTLELTILPDPMMEAFFQVTNPSCEGNADGSILLDSVQNGIGPFSIFINEESHPTGSIGNLSPGDFEYFIEDFYGCTTEASIRLSDPVSFTLELGEDQVVDLGRPVQVNPVFSEPAENFVWLSADSISCTEGCERAEWTPSNTGWVTLTGTAISSGCEASDSIFIEVLPVRDVFIPNVFSPNFDGFNDEFAIMGVEPNVQLVEELVVFNRWGAVVFEGRNLFPNDLAAGWDGTLDGTNLDEGVYLYVAQIRFLDGVVLTYSGGITLMR